MKGRDKFFEIKLKKMKIELRIIWLFYGPRNLIRFRKYGKPQCKPFESLPENCVWLYCIWFFRLMISLRKEKYWGLYDEEGN